MYLYLPLCITSHLALLMFESSRRNLTDRLCIHLFTCCQWKFNHNKTSSSVHLSWLVSDPLTADDSLLGCSLISGPSAPLAASSATSSVSSAPTSAASALDDFSLLSGDSTQPKAGKELCQGWTESSITYDLPTVIFDGNFPVLWVAVFSLET